MDTRQKELLRKLVETPSPSGFEGPIQDIVHAELSSFCPDVTVDVYGNVVARVEGRSPRAILLAGHSDEIGLIVKHIDDRGFLYVGPVGGVDPLVLLGQRVQLLGPKGAVPGVIGRMPFHLIEKDEREKEKKVRLQDLWIDIGAGSRAEAEKATPIGTPAVWGPPELRPMAGHLVTARAFDNKVGVYIMIETLRALAAAKKPPLTILGASTIQEECGVWGAGPVAYRLEPVAAVAVDVTHATDYPGIDPKFHGELHLGKGPVIIRGVKSSKVLNRLLDDSAVKHRITTQVEAESGRFGTDADPMSDRRGGIPVNSLGIPLRYMHTATEVISLKDADAAVKLLTVALGRLAPDTDFRAFPFGTPAD